jgi:hypothetical protein
LAAILLIAVSTVEFGGLASLGMLTRRTPGYLDNPLRQNMIRAGHADAGVWLVFALVALLWVDQTDLGEPLKLVIRIAFVAAPILMPLGFFLSVTQADAQRPNGVISGAVRARRLAVPSARSLPCLSTAKRRLHWHLRAAVRTTIGQLGLLPTQGLSGHP